MSQPIVISNNAFASSVAILGGIEDHVRASLDMVEARLRAGDTLSAMQLLIDDLRGFRERLNVDDWRDFAKDVILKHPVSNLLFQCPLTRRSNVKPRGYAGDAELLDHIYGLGAASAAPHPATLAGQIYFYTVNSPACQAVRQRREILATMIDNTAACSWDRKPEILSIACGHLREAALSRALQNGEVGRFVALDQDEDSLALLQNEYARLGVVTQAGSVRSIIARKSAFANMHFVYAAGLFDYLADPVAMRLIERMFEFLQPGGKLLIANFTPAGPDVGYMETFMDWWLILRTKDEMRRLFSTLPADEVGSIEVFEDEAGTIVYATAEKRG